LMVRKSVTVSESPREKRPALAPWGNPWPFKSIGTGSAKVGAFSSAFVAWGAH
jgi:hypothetical protein